MWIYRYFSTKITTFSQQYPILVITGARQVGKSSLVKKLFPEHTYISLDLPSDSEFAENDPENFLRTYRAPVIIDEIQYAPKLFRWIKKAVDDNPSLKGAYILTGSQKFSLMNNVQESLAGRAMLIDLLPLSLSEILTEEKTKSLFQLILRGGLPALYKDSSLNAFDYIRSYIGTYLERDVKDVLNVNSLRDFERFIRICALRAANLINKADIARDVGVSPTTVNQWLSVLQASNQVHILEPWYTNKSKSVIKTPKLYFFDTGVLCFLLNIRDEKTLLDSPLKGAIWENFVFVELYKRLNLQGLASSLHFWSDRQKEVDFLIDRGGIIDLMEVKWNSLPSLDARENLDHFEKRSSDWGLKIQSKSVICTSEKSFPLGGKDVYVRSIFDLDLEKPH